MAKFAANALPSIATTISPFVANRGFEPCMSFNAMGLHDNGFTRTSLINQDLPMKMHAIWEFL